MCMYRDAVGIDLCVEGGGCGCSCFVPNLHKAFHVVRDDITHVCMCGLPLIAGSCIEEKV